MKSIFPLLLAAFFLSIPVWHHDLSEARQIAVSEHRHILLNFSGSDWCGPCIRMQKEVFESEVFMNLADSELVMVNADFPRMKKNQLPARQQALNDAMADQYDAKGKFPFTVLLDAHGKVLREWEGYSGLAPAAFRDEVQQAIAADQLQAIAADKQNQ
jgi:thioredoxin-related protein